MELNKESEKIIISPKEIESYFDDEDNPTTSEKIPTCGSAKDLASSIFNLDVRAALNKTIEEYPYEKYTKVFYDLMKKHIVKISYPCDSMEIQPYEGYIKFYEDENNEFDYYKPYLIIAEKGVINTFDKYKTIYAITGGGKEPYGSIFITKRFYEKSSRIKDACNESEFETDFWLFFILSYRAYTVFFRRDFLTYQIKKLFNNNVNEFRNTLLYYLEIFLRKNFIGKGHEFALLQGLDYLELNIKVKKLEEVIDPTSNDTNRKKSEENPTETNIGLLTRFILGEKIPSSKKGDFTKKILIEFKFKLPSCGEPSRTLLHKLIFGLQKTLDKQLDNLKNLIDDLKTEKYKAWIKRILIDKHDELDLKKVEEKIQEQITRLEPTK